MALLRLRVSLSFFPSPSRKTCRDDRIIRPFFLRPFFFCPGGEIGALTLSCAKVPPRLSTPSFSLYPEFQSLPSSFSSLSPFSPGPGAASRPRGLDGGAGGGLLPQPSFRERRGERGRMPCQGRKTRKRERENGEGGRGPCRVVAPPGSFSSLGGGGGPNTTSSSLTLPPGRDPRKRAREIPPSSRKAKLELLPFSSPWPRVERRSEIWAFLSAYTKALRFAKSLFRWRQKVAKCSSG